MQSPRVPSSLPVPAITPRSPAHAALIKRATTAYSEEQNPERQRMLEHLLRNTLRVHYKEECADKLSSMLDGIENGKFTSFKDFSMQALVPFAKQFHPAPPTPKPMTLAQFVQNRQREEALRKGHIIRLSGKGIDRSATHAK